MAYNNLWSQYLGNEHPCFPALGAPGWVPESRPPAIRRSLKRAGWNGSSTRHQGSWDPTRNAMVWPCQAHLGMVPWDDSCWKWSRSSNICIWGHICVIASLAMKNTIPSDNACSHCRIWIAVSPVKSGHLGPSFPHVYDHFGWSRF